MRLNKFISESGLCSRREADRFIEQGNVLINGKRANIGDRVLPGNRVTVNGHELEPRQSKNTIFIALNKPAGITSTTELNVAGNIIDFVNHSERVFPIGRLDKDSEGLIFLTNDGDVVNKILRAGNNHEKEYIVTVNKPITEHFIQSMSAGIPMDGRTTKKCPVKKESPFVFRITLIQGLNRQIRRMCEYLGYEVKKLERIRIMNIGLKGLPTGDWRELTPEETNIIYSMVEKSSSSEEKKSSPRNIQKKKSNRTSDSPKANANPDNRSRFKRRDGGKSNGPGKKSKNKFSGRSRRG
jgi:23S rRNA pseudouridine2604 synthase